MTELNSDNMSQRNLENDLDDGKPVLGFCTSSSVNAHELKLENELLDQEEQDELRKLLLVNVEELPSVPPSAVEFNFTTYFAPDLMKPGHDQFVHRHANGLCVIGLASTHVAFKDEGGIVSVDFNVGKSDRSEIKVTGKRKKVHSAADAA
ncbi:protein Simiate [Dorcoceras hygrometricum]|uniref:Protein Simiate n=1 Tax=Dorcoceras hygrometricum TaxID=472368 RepID=A0A2Z7ALP8_9LAMI|nr:protein Simiate [Dorcoceras hygrometricum]